MALAKAVPANDIINGLAVASQGDGPPKKYDGAPRTQHVLQPSGAYYENLDTRYRYHGGAGGSGNWEH